MFIAADINKRVLKKKQSQLQFQQILLSATKDNVTSQMKGRQATVEAQNKNIQNWNNLSADDKQQNINDRSELYKLINSYTTSSITKNSKLSEVSYKNDTYYQQYQIEDQRLDAEQDSLESQLKLLGSEIESQEKLVQNNISSDMKMWCYGGG